MSVSRLPAVAALCALPVLADAAEAPRVVLGGEVGDAAAAAPPWPATVEALKARGLEPFPAALRRRDCCFVVGRGK